MTTANIDGIDIYYERHGEAGEPLVLVHGYTGDITDWRHQIPEFSRTHRILMMDLRGHGKSEAPSDRSAYSIDRMSRDVEALVDEVGFERYHLVGHSMGGAIAQEIALRSGPRLMSLTLHDTGFRFSASRSPAMQKWNEHRRQVADEQGMRALADLPNPIAPPPFMPAERREETKERLARMSPDAFIGAGNALNDWPGTKDRLNQIAVPTLVIYGDLDAEGLVKASQIIAVTIPNATLVVVPQAAHSPQYERPELFNEALRAHLAGGAASAPK
jgi:pimeloyl-ACP methyl ester carboxylesterase